MNETNPPREVQFASNLSLRLGARLKETGENYAQFARRLNLPYGWLIRISTKGVKQTSRRTSDHLQTLADELGVDVNWFWGQPNPEQDPMKFLDEFQTKYPIEHTIFLAWRYCAVNDEDDEMPKDIHEWVTDFLSRPGAGIELLGKVIRTRITVYFAADAIPDPLDDSNSHSPK